MTEVEHTDASQFIEITLEVTDSEWPANHRNWRTQVNDLHSTIEGNERLAARRPFDPNSKGIADALVVALGSAGAVKAFADIMTVWLAGRSSRSAKVALVKGGSPVEIELTGYSADEIERLVNLAIKETDQESR